MHTPPAVPPAYHQTFSPSICDFFSPVTLEVLENHPFAPSLEFVQLRRELSTQGLNGDEIAAVLSQWELREQAARKFGRESAGRMLFNRDSLEQATQLPVAKLHAATFRAAKAEEIADLGCGIGADSRAFAQAGIKVTAVELNPRTAAICAYNLRDYPNTVVQCTDAVQYFASKYPTAVFADPARRDARGRIHNPNEWSPPFSEIISWIDHCRYLAVKIAPGIAHSKLPDGFHAQWVSSGGTVVEACLYSASLIPPGRSAVKILDGGEVERFVVPELDCANAASTEVEVASELGDYVYEPDSALIRSGGIAALAKQLRLAIISSGIAYLTGDELGAHSPWVQAYRLIDILPLKPKAIKGYLREHGFSRVEIKKRGWQGDPTAFRKQLLTGIKPGNNQATCTLILTQVQGRHRALVVEPL